MSSTNIEKEVNSNYDIMIVGGGPAGVSTWLHLHKYAPELAARTVLIEKEQYPRDKICGGAIGSWGQEVLKFLGIEIGIPYIPIHNVEYRFGKDVFCYKQKDFLKIFRRIEFDNALANSSIERGMKLNQNEHFLEMFTNKNHLVVTTNRGKYKVKVLVGADGAISKVRENMKSIKKPNFTSAFEVFAPVNPQYDTEFVNNTAVLDFTPMNENLQGYVWHFPCIKDGKPSMNHGICHTRINKNRPQPNIKKILSKELQARNIVCQSSQWSGHPIPWFAEQPSLAQPNVLLVGDAAGIEPLLGGGIHLSLSYGDLAAKEIIDAFKNKDFSFKNYNDRLNDHNTGKYIKKLTYLSFQVYNNKMNILDAVKKVLLIK